MLKAIGRETLTKDQHQVVTELAAVNMSSRTSIEQQNRNNQWVKYSD